MLDSDDIYGILKCIKNDIYKKGLIMLIAELAPGTLIRCSIPTKYRDVLGQPLRREIEVMIKRNNGVELLVQSTCFSRFQYHLMWDDVENLEIL